MLLCEGSTRMAPSGRVEAGSRTWLLCAFLSLSLMTAGCGAGSHTSIQPPPPSFALSLAPGGVSVQPGGSGTATVRIVPANGFSSSVSLAASGVPSGVSVSFNPASASSSSTLTLSVNSSAALGTVAIMVTGTSGSLSATAAINLTVFLPPPPGALPASFFALNNVDPTDDPVKDGMSSGAVGHPIRLAWPYIETARGVFDFSFYDQYAAIAPREGPNGIVAIMDLTLGMTPGWAVANQTTALCRTLSGGVVGCQAAPDNIQDWKDFILALVQHYDGSTPSRPHLKYYEIWNEWNVNDSQNGFWIGPIPSLVALQTTACSIIHAADAFSMVLTPSTVGPAMTANDQAPMDLANYFFYGGSNCPGGPNNMIDGVSFHGNLGLANLNPYPLPGEGCTQQGCNGSIVQITSSYRQILQQNALPTTPMLDTEGGFESANITDIDQRAAWLAQFYILQGSLNASEQLDWVSWFTWGWASSPGVAGQIETENHVPDHAGVAYNQVDNWLVGRLTSPCVGKGKLWTCDLTGSGNYEAEILWDDSQTCSQGTCTTTAQSVPPWAVKMRDLAGNIASITGNKVPVGLKPVIVENQ